MLRVTVYCLQKKKKRFLKDDKKADIKISKGDSRIKKTTFKIKDI